MRKFVYNRWFHTILLLALLACAVLVRIQDYTWSRALSNLAFDQYNVLKPRPALDKVVIINIDDDSLARLGQWPWPRTNLATLLLNLKKMGALSVAFDGVLAEPDRTSPEAVLQTVSNPTVKTYLATQPSHDRVFADAIRDTGFFASGFSFGSYKEVQKPRIVMSIKATKSVKSVFLKQSRHFDNVASFIPVLQDAVAGNGSFMADPETDGIIRKTGMVFSDSENLYPSLSLEAIRLSLPAPRPPIQIDPSNLPVLSLASQYRIQIGDYKIPVDQDGILRVYFRNFDPHKDYVSAYKIIEPEFYAEAESQIKGHIVLIGSSAEGLKDLRSSPLRLFIPGVEVHANAIEQILNGQYLQRPFLLLGQEMLVMILIGLIIIFLSPFIGAVTLAGLTAAVIGVISYTSWFMFLHNGLLLDPVYPSLTILALFVLASLLAYVRTEAERKQVRTAFSHYISPDFMKELTDNPEKLKLGGELKDLSVMFTDIRGFTSISEKLSPEALIHLMNDFLTPMSSLVMENRGTIDKYMGDAMMAFWNAPLDDPDHARHACITALKMNEALVPINEQVKDKGITLAAGIGVYTGQASVGNMGSRQRFAYSALGDTVNTASRLEGQTKAYGVSILIGESTAQYVRDMAVLELDLLRVKGKKEPVRIYTLIGDVAEAQSDTFKILSSLHNRMIAAYRVQDFDDALALIDECSGKNAAMGGFYAMMTSRIAELSKNRPGDGWDGIYEATSK